jgi:hypothetical protein
MCFDSILSITVLMHKIYSSEVVLGSDASEEGSSSDCSSDYDTHDEEAADSELDEEDETTLTLVVTEPDNGQEIQDLESGCE